MSSSRPSTFVDAALLPVYAHKKLGSSRRIQKWELARYGPETNEVRLQSLQRNSDAWDADHGDQLFFVMSPSRWRFLPRLDFREVAPDAEEFAVPVYGGTIPFVAVKKDLVVKGLLEETASVRRLQVPENQQLVRLFYQMLPDARCVQKMARYIYGSEAPLLHLLSAVGSRKLYSDGFSGRTVPVGPRAAWNKRYVPDYRLDLRLSPGTLVRYLALGDRARFNNLNKVLLQSPGCSSPVILVSRQSFSLGWRKAKLGTSRVWRRMFAASSLARVEDAERSSAGFLFVFHLRRDCPWLLLQPATGLSLMPAGLQYQLMLRTRKFGKWVYHFMVSRPN